MRNFSILLILISLIFIPGCNSSTDPVDNSFDVDFYLKTLDKVAKSGTFEFDGTSVSVDNSGVYTRHFEKGGTHTIDNVQMDGTKGHWLIIVNNK